MLSSSNKTQSINIIKFCDDLNELSEFNMALSNNNSNELNQELADINDQNEIKNTETQCIFNVFFLIKHDNVNVAQNNSKNELVRNSIKQNINLNNSWYATIFYVNIIF